MILVNKGGLCVLMMLNKLKSINCQEFKQSLDKFMPDFACLSFSTTQISEKSSA